MITRYAFFSLFSKSDKVDACRSADAWNRDADDVDNTITTYSRSTHPPKPKILELQKDKLQNLADESYYRIRNIIRQIGIIFPKF